MPFDYRVIYWQLLVKELEPDLTIAATLANYLSRPFSCPLIIAYRANEIESAMSLHISSDEIGPEHLLLGAVLRSSYRSHLAFRFANINDSLLSTADKNLRRA